MNIPRRIKLLSAAGALSLAPLTGLIATAPAHALTLSGPYLSYYFTIYLNPSPASGCTVFTLTGSYAQFLGDTSVDVNLYENTNYGWQQLVVDNNSTASIPVNPSTGAISPTPVWWSGLLSAGVYGTGQYQAEVTDSAGRGGDTFVVPCP